ncbi:unnamed protein product, partial [Mesorhabditis belari]|uniref:Uncharacterized protein n=1 Tax=Mesorhabditis belari TaxID=2138241 RepID=A0AAF3FCC0_9BILA
MSRNSAKSPDQKPKTVQPRVGRSKGRQSGSKSKERIPSSEGSGIFGHLQNISRNWYTKIFSQVESKEVIAGDKQGVLNSSTEEELRKIFHTHKEVFPESWVSADMPDTPHADYERVTLSHGIRVIEVPTVRMKLQPRLSSGISDPWRKYGPYLKLCEIGGTGVRLNREKELQVYTIEKGAAPPPPPARKPIMTADEVETRLEQRQLIQAQRQPQQPQQQARQAPEENSQICSENRKSNNGSQDKSSANSRKKIVQRTAKSSKSGCDSRRTKHLFNVNF